MVFQVLNKVVQLTDFFLIDLLQLPDFVLELFELLVTGLLLLFFVSPKAGKLFGEVVVLFVQTRQTLALVLALLFQVRGLAFKLSDLGLVLVLEVIFEFLLLDLHFLRVLFFVNFQLVLKQDDLGLMFDDFLFFFDHDSRHLLLQVVDQVLLALDFALTLLIIDA